MDNYSKLGGYDSKAGNNSKLGGTDCVDKKVIVYQIERRRNGGQVCSHGFGCMFTE